MLHSVMIALDGSAYSQAGVELAIRWARRFHCAVTGVAIVDEPDIRAQTADSPRPQSYERLLAEAQGQAGKILDQFAWRCSQAGITFERHADIGRPWYYRILW